MAIPQMLTHKYHLLQENLRKLESVVLAFSGGVDSTFLLTAIIESGIRYLAVTALSPTTPTHDKLLVQELVQEIGANHRVIASGELADENFVNNSNNRCFYCKSDLFKRLASLAREENFQAVLDGSIVDDLHDYRPGFQARNDYHVLSPLLDAGLTKAEIRILSKQKNLKTWDKPASPCLSSRISYGEKITIEALSMVDRAEECLRQCGFMELRVRKQGDSARIELPQGDIPRFLSDETLRDYVVTSLKDIGFLYVSLDLEGFQSGKLNRKSPKST